MARARTAAARATTAASSRRSPRTRPRALLALAFATGCIALALAFGAPTIDHGVVALDAKRAPGRWRRTTRSTPRSAARAGSSSWCPPIPMRARARARADAVAEVAEKLAADGVIEGYDALGTLAPSLAAQRARLDERDGLDLPAKRAHPEARARRPKASRPTRSSLRSRRSRILPTRSPTSRQSDSPAIEWVKPPSLAVTTIAAPRRHVRSHSRRIPDQPRKHARGCARPIPRRCSPASPTSRCPCATRSRAICRACSLAAIAMVIMVLGISLRRMSACRARGGSCSSSRSRSCCSSRACSVSAGTCTTRSCCRCCSASRWTRHSSSSRRRGAKRSIDDALAEQAPLAATTALTTAAGFGALIVCRFGGLVDVGKVGALGSRLGSCARCS